MNYTEKVNGLDCIYVLSGGMRKNDENIVVPGDFNTLDHHGLICEGKSRCQAAAYLWQLNQQIKLISSGKILPFGYPELVEKAQYSRVYKQELARLGVKPDSILESLLPNDTFTELVSLVEFISKYNWQKVLVMCNRAQLERTRILLDVIRNYPLGKDLSDDFKISVKFFSNRLIYRKEQFLTPVFLAELTHFKLLNAQIEVIASEDVVEYFEPDKKDFFEEVYKTEGLIERIKIEKSGIDDILNGVYYIPKIIDQNTI